MPTDVVEPLLTLDELANVLRVAPTTIRRWIGERNRRLPPYVRVGRRILWSPDAVRALAGGAK
jgi:excisionase family DNA binding protein